MIPFSSIYLDVLATEREFFAVHDYQEHNRDALQRRVGCDRPPRATVQYSAMFGAQSATPL